MKYCQSSSNIHLIGVKEEEKGNWREAILEEILQGVV